MLRSIALTTILGTVAVLAPAGAATAADARLPIVQAWQKFRSGVQQEQEFIEVEIHRSGHPALVKALWRRTAFGPRSERLSVKFSAPSADAGLGLLVERTQGEPDQIWLRLPSWPSGRKIVGERETKYFAGTAFTFEDSKQLIGEHTESFDYRFVQEGGPASVIVATPRPGVITGYGKREIALDEQGVPVRIDYFDVDGQPVKTLRFEDMVFPAPGRWRANRIVLDHHQQKSRTVLKVLGRQFNAGMTERVFSLPFLAEPEHAGPN